MSPARFRRRSDVIVVSFKDAAIARFHAKAPQIALAPGQSSLFDYFLGGTPLAGGTAAVQVWFSGSAPDDWATHNRVLDACVDGVMVTRPKLLERILEVRKIVRPGRASVDPCAP